MTRGPDITVNDDTYNSDNLLQDLYRDIPSQDFFLGNINRITYFIYKSEDTYQILYLPNRDPVDGRETQCMCTGDSLTLIFDYIDLAKSTLKRIREELKKTHIDVTNNQSDNIWTTWPNSTLTTEENAFVFSSATAR